MARRTESSEGAVAEDFSPPSREEFEKARQETLATLLERRHWPKGSVSRCPKCGERAFAGSDDLEYRVVRPGGILVFCHLRGARCGACTAVTLEPGDMIRVEGESAARIPSDYEAKVSKIGSGSLGTYWPKDVVRNMGLDSDKRVFIQVLSGDTALLRFAEREKEEEEAEFSAPPAAWEDSRAKPARKKQE